MNALLNPRRTRQKKMNPKQTRALILKLAQDIFIKHGVLPNDFFEQDLKLFLAVYFAKDEEESLETAPVHLDEIGL